MQSQNFLTNFLIPRPEGHLKSDGKPRTNLPTTVQFNWRGEVPSPPVPTRQGKGKQPPPQHRPWRPLASADPRHSCPGEANRFFAPFGKSAIQLVPSRNRKQSNARIEKQQERRKGKKKLAEVSSHLPSLSARSLAPPPSAEPSDPNPARIAPHASARHEAAEQQQLTTDRPPL